MKTFRRPLALAISFGLASCFPVQAAEPDETDAVPSVTVAGSRGPLDPDLPATSVSRTREELLQQQNVFNPEDALRNLPSMTIRKRYSGDRNALVGGRSFSTSQAPRALVLMDGYLLSNFLGRFDAPRWNMVAPEEIARVDVLYGPFSALYTGNSMGTTIAFTTVKPTGFMGSARLASQVQAYDNYGLKDRYRNYQGSLLLGDRLASGAWYKLMANHQDSTSQPMQYYGVNASAAGVFTRPSGNAVAVPVTGIVYDTGPTGLRRAVFGANAGAIDHTKQDTVKATFGYDFASGISAEGFVAWWQNDSVNTNASLLRDAAGNTVWSGRVSSAGNVFDLPANTFAPFDREERHLQTGLTLKTTNRTGWNASAVMTRYRILEDTQRNAGVADPYAAAGGSGSAVLRDGTGFRTLDLQARYVPTAGDWTGGAHTLTVGLHASDYALHQVTRNLADWRNAAGVQTQYMGGRTKLSGLYAQDAWRFLPAWTATLGLRLERWKASDGVQRFTNGPSTDYARRSDNATSPKLSVTWATTPDLDLRVSAGKGTRFPTVAELFQGTQSGASIIVADPDLKPERSTALEITADQRFSHGSARATLFQDDVRDTIWTQLNLAVFPNVTNNQNVGRVRTRGLELAGVADRLGIDGLSLDASIGWSKAVILENANYQPSVGRIWVRVPRVRSTTTLVYAPTPLWSAAATWRYSGRQFNEINNSDINPDVYGGLSRQKQLDLRLRFLPARQVELAAGIDNVNDGRAYQSHPFPGRTFFAEARYAF
ncbi:TonB-dependent receptor [Pseudoduganella lurida]|nr:TonB-dependent receptor [Pseudoduganella lurida]